MGKLSTKAGLNKKLILLLVLVLLLSSVYKFFEWNTLKGLASLDAKVQDEEIALEEQSGKLGNELAAIFASTANTENVPAAESMRQFSEAESMLKLGDNAVSHYLGVIKKNDSEYKILSFHLNS
ncbi:MAG: hypothetical protein AAB599_01815 [Patescibacteria group bacterium]